MLSPALIYIDTDRSVSGVYHCREPHFPAAAALGWRCITVIEAAHEHRARLQATSDEIVALPVLSVQTLVAAVAALADRLEVRVLMGYVGQTVPRLDLAVLLQEAARRLELPFVPAQAIENSNNKFLMRKVLDAQGVSNLRAELVGGAADLTAAADRIGFPLIVKPVFGAGSALIKKCDTLEELHAHYEIFQGAFHATGTALHFGGSAHRFQLPDGTFRDYVPGQSVLLEEYADGVEGSVECLVVQGEVKTLLLQEKLLVTHECSTVIEHLLITPPTGDILEQKAMIFEYCRACVSAMGLDNTFVHFEFRLTKDGPRVIEINPRVGGFYVNAALRDLVGLDPFLVNLLILSGALDNDWVDAAERLAARPPADFRTMFVVYPPRSGWLARIDGVEQAIQVPGMIEHKMVKTPRRIDKDFEEGYIGKFWAKAASKQDVFRIYDHVRRALRPIFNVEEDRT